MKLKKKITALCAAILLLVAASLCAAMLWQVREQSYGALLQRSLDSLDELAVSLETAVYQTSYEMGSALSWRVFLTHCFRSCGTAGSALYINGECLFAATPVDPESYLTVSSGRAAASARVRAYGRNFLVLGKAVDFHGDTYCIYLVAEATYIHSQLRELAVRFALLALAVMLLGLAMVRYLVGRTLRPLSALSEAAGSVAAGNYGQRVPVSSADEVGMLAQDFNRMALAVESHVAALQERTERQKLFTAAVTHELKTPLTSLLLNVNTLQTVYLPEENQAALLESMDHKLRWLDTMVRKLLMLLSVKKNAAFSATSVPELLARVQQLTEGICAKYGVSLKTDCRVDMLSMDADLMCSALANLVENSAKASAPGQVVSVSADEIGFTVTDHGRGIPAKDLPRVTEAFYTGDPSRSKKNGGFGLGLALVREIAVVHGGTLALESTPGNGTTAHIVLPEVKT